MCSGSARISSASTGTHASKARSRLESVRAAHFSRNSFVALSQLSTLVIVILVVSKHMP